MARKQKRRNSRKKKKSLDGLFSRLKESAVFAGVGANAARIGFTLALLGGLAFGLAAMERYVKNIAMERKVDYRVELVNPPEWLTRDLMEQLAHSLDIQESDLAVDQAVADRWAQALQENPWVRQLHHLHKRYDGVVELDCELRVPIASFEQRGRIYYIDREHVTIPAAAVQLHLVRLDGPPTSGVELGEAVSDRKLIAGLEVLQLILQVDSQMERKEQLWTELARLDVSNYQGRLNPREAHLTLYTERNTPIYWGAAVNEATAHYEANEKFKLTTLYRQFKQAGSLDRYQYVELRNFRKEKTDPLKPRTES